MNHEGCLTSEITRARKMVMYFTTNRTTVTTFAIPQKPWLGVVG